MREGILKFNEENNRYGLWDYEKEYWIDNGFHCGECLDVFVKGISGRSGCCKKIL